jgi:hypothetical protein
LDEAADSWVALFCFLGFGLFMAVVMVPQFRVYWPEAQVFAVVGGFTWVNSYWLYRIVLVVFVILVDVVLSFCFLRILRARHREGAL